MIYCTQCGTTIRDAHQFCWNCGAKAEGPTPVTKVPAPLMPQSQTKTKPAAPHSRFAHMFGLDPRIAFVSLVVDMMLNAGDIASAGLLVPVGIMAGLVLGYVTYRAQINWYGDDPESARLKAIILGLLTAIPTPLPELLYVPAGLIGLFDGFFRRDRTLSPR